MSTAKTPKSRFVPAFDEQSIFIMGLSALAVYFLSPEMQLVFSSGHAETKERARFLLYFGLLAAPFLLSVFHVFSSRSKSPMERSLFLYFGVTWSFLVGLYSGVTMLQSESLLLLVSSLWNIWGALSVFSLYNAPEPEVYVSDRDTTLMQLLVGILVASGIVYVGVFAYPLHWSVTLSLCVSYAEIASSVLRGS